MLPETMRAMVLTGHGGFDRLEYHQDWPTPEVLPDTVVIHVGACGLNNTDINTRIGWYDDEVTGGISADSGSEGISEKEDASGGWGDSGINFPRIQGADVCGAIVAVGEGVDPARLGERVMVDPWLLDDSDWCNASLTGYFGSECDGGYAEYTRVRSRNAVPVNSPLSDEELATFPCAYTTAENMCFRTHIAEGETVVVSGASGGVGSAAIQLARMRGARVIGIAAPEKADALIELGVDAVVDRNSTSLTADIVAAAGKQPEVALDVVGGPQFQPLLEALRQGGRYSSAGAIAGPVVEFDLRKFFYRDLQLSGATICPAGTMQRVVAAIETGKIKPLLAATFPLAELHKAQEMFLGKRFVGNIVVSPVSPR